MFIKHLKSKMRTKNCKDFKIEKLSDEYFQATCNGPCLPYTGIFEFSDLKMENPIKIIRTGSKIYIEKML